MGKNTIEKIAESPARIMDEAVKAVERLPRQKPVRVVQKYWGALGPGLTTGAADDDPSGIATYSQTGAQFQFGLIWLALFTTPLMIAVQEICARIGLVTGRGISGVIKHYYSRPVLYITVLLLFVANTFNIGADIAAMSASIKLLVDLPFWFLAVAITLISLVLQIYVPYHKYAKFLKILTLVLFAYVITAFIVHVDWLSILHHTIVPSITFSKDSFLMITAILGTTISPYLFYWQASQEIEQRHDEEAMAGVKEKANTLEVTPKEVKTMREDVAAGMIFSNLAMFFIIAVTGTVLFSQNITITTAADAAKALQPLAGQYAYLLFTIGIIGVGLLGIPTLAGSASYAISEAYSMPEGLDKKLSQAYGFYGVIIIATVIGLVINFVGIDPIKALIMAAVVNGIVAPILMTVLLLISNNRRIMGEWKNGPWANTVGWVAAIFMYVSAGAAILSLFF